MRSHLRRSGKRDIEVPCARAFANKSVLVTGAAGSIGSVLCNRVVFENARILKLVSLTESGLYNIEKALRRNYGKYRETKIIPILGDYGDRDMMRDALLDIDIVVHAGAHKHVPLCESNPVAAIKNNIIGTFLLMETAAACGVAQFCAISTDKAVKPASIMGATKRAVELLCQSMHSTKTSFFIVRFGNVLDSAGSVLPLWREQIALGGPITITDPRCTRYFMSIDEAVTLIENVIYMNPENGTFVFDMGQPRRIIDIARELIVDSGKRVEISTIGLRKGEKVTEELNYGGTRERVSNRIDRITEEEAHLINPTIFRRMAVAANHRDAKTAVKALWELVQC